MFTARLAKRWKLPKPSLARRLFGTDSTRNFDLVDLSAPYPRDLVGYGPNPPDPQWPNNAHLAISFINNFEEGSEKNVLNGDPCSEELGQEIPLWDRFEGIRNPHVESMMNYGTRATIWRFMRAFDERGMKLTTWGVAVAYARNPEITKFIHNGGHELASHGYRWYDYEGVPEDVELKHTKEIIRIQQDLVGTRPRGLGIVRSSRNTYKIAMEQCGFDYYSDRYDDDLPFYDYSLGTPHLMIPYSLTTNDGNFWFGTYSNPKDFYDVCMASVNMLLEEGAKGSPKMLTIALHNRIVGYPNRQWWFNKFLDYVAENKKIWVARRDEIADHWRKVHPPSNK